MVGQCDTKGFEEVRVYFKAVKGICTKAGVWPKLRALGTDGCAAMRSTTHYAGVDAHGAI